MFPSNPREVPVQFVELDGEPLSAALLNPKSLEVPFFGHGGSLTRALLMICY